MSEQKNNKTPQERTKKKKSAFLEAMVRSLGVVTTACKSVEINRSTYYGWMESDEVFAQEINDIDNVVIDFAESKLYELIKSGNVAATIFLLKTKGKARGYVERTEHQITNQEQPMFGEDE